MDGVIPMSRWIFTSFAGAPLLVVPMLLVLVACGPSMPGSPCDEVDCSFSDINIDLPAISGARVTFRMIGEATGDQDFVAFTADTELGELALSELDLPFAERTLFPVGPIAPGDGGHNFQQAEPPDFEWNWHCLPEDWTLTEAAEPECDSNAVLVEQAIDYWVDTVGRFCPSGARVVSVVTLVD
jgi:hypothetical protein